MAIGPQRSRSSEQDVTRDVLLGFVRIHILYHAGHAPVYGLWLIEELARHGYKMSAGTLYPVLHTLASRGLLDRKDKLADGKIRKYYSLTSKGRKALGRMQRKLGELVAEVLPKTPRPRSARSRR